MWYPSSKAPITRLMEFDETFTFLFLFFISYFLFPPQWLEGLFLDANNRLSLVDQQKMSLYTYNFVFHVNDLCLLYSFRREGIRGYQQMSFFSYFVGFQIGRFFLCAVFPVLQVLHEIICCHHYVCILYIVYFLFFKCFGHVLVCNVYKFFLCLCFVIVFVDISNRNRRHYLKQQRIPQKYDTNFFSGQCDDECNSIC